MNSAHLLTEAEELRKLRALVRDLAENGLRFDLTPSFGFSGDGWLVVEQYRKYVVAADQTIRQRAREALAGTLGERMRLFAEHIGECDTCADWRGGGPDPGCVEGNKVYRGE